MVRDSREESIERGGNRVASGAGGWTGAAVASPAARVDRSDGGIACTTVMMRKPRWKRKHANCRPVPRVSSSEYFERSAIDVLQRISDVVSTIIIKEMLCKTTM